MKKTVTTLFMLLVFVASFTISCEHENPIPIPTPNACNLQISYITTPDTTNNGHGDGTLTVFANQGMTQFSLNGGQLSYVNLFTGLDYGQVCTIIGQTPDNCRDTISVIIDSIHGNGGGNPNPCGTITVTTTTTNPTTGQSNGSIVVVASPTGTYTYSIGGVFQSSNTFSNLAAGTYVVTAKNSSGCVGTTNVTLTAAATLISFGQQIQPTIYSTCGQATCHNHSNNYQTYDDIVGTRGTTWQTCSKLPSFIQRVKGTTSLSSTGLHDMPTSGTTAWTTFVNTYFIPWVNQGYLNN